MRQPLRAVGCLGVVGGWGGGAVHSSPCSRLYRCYPGHCSSQRARELCERTATERRARGCPPQSAGERVRHSERLLVLPEAPGGGWLRCEAFPV